MQGPFRKSAAWRPLRRLAALLAVFAAMLLAAAPLGAEQGPPGRRLALLVGVGSFADRSLSSLEYAGRDLTLVRDWLVNPRGGAFDPADVVVLRDDSATRSAVLGQMERLAATARPGDLVFIYVTSHGLQTENRQLVGIATHDSRATGRVGPLGPILECGTTVTRPYLQDFLSRLAARRRVVVIDACHGAQIMQGCTVANAGGASPDGAVTLVATSSMPTQRSWESSQLCASIFTYYLVEGLSRFGGDFVRAFNYSQENTGQRSSLEKGFLQTPLLLQAPPGHNLRLSPES